MKKVWDTDELATHWCLTFEDHHLLKNKLLKNHLGFSIQLKHFQYSGKFLHTHSDISTPPLEHVAEQLNVSVSDFESYDFNSRTGRRHCIEILNYLGIQRLTSTDKDAFSDWLRQEIFHQGTTISEAIELAYDWFKKQKVEYPTEAVLERLVRSAFYRYEQEFFNQIIRELRPSAKDKMDHCLENVERGIEFGRLKADPGRVGLESVLAEVEKLHFIQSLDLPQGLFQTCNIKALTHYYQRVSSESAWRVKEHPPEIRYALLGVFLFFRQREIIDGLIELFIQIVHRLTVKAERKLIKELLSDFRKVHGKSTLLFRIAEAALLNPEGRVKDVVYPVAGENVLQNLLKEFKSSGPGYRQQVHKIIRSSYGNHYRRMVPKILEALSFCSGNTQHRPVLEALEWIQHNRDNSQRFIPLDEGIPIDGVIRKQDQEVVLEEDAQGRERINRINYEICVLQALRDKLRCKEIWVMGADKFRNPDEDLPADFEDKREDYYLDLGHSTDSSEFIEKIQERMRSALTELDEGIPRNQKVRLLNRGKKNISITPFEAQEEPPSLTALKREIAGRWPMTSLLDVLKEADLRVGFTDHFKTVADREILDRQSLQRRLLLCLYGMGTNTGLKRVSGNRHGISYKELLHVRRRYVHKAALRNAIGQVANAIFSIRNADVWGEGSTSCASDSKKFGSWDQNLMTEWHIRYGGRGVMIYWHVEKKSTCIYSQLKRCSSSEVAAMIEGVLRHCTDMTIDRQYVDSHGQSEVAFAFCHLLGFDLLPRLKAIATQKLYRPDGDATEAFPNLERIMTRPINWELISQQYDEMVKYATALKQGTANPEAILRRFTRNNIQHPTYRALSELGKAVKTIFLCRYLGSEALRQEINEGLNVVENWNSANSFIFYGKGGEVATNRLEDQELSVLALHLLQICLVYVNTLMIQQVLTEPAWHSRMKQEDYRALSPLIYNHINPYGIFELDMDLRLPIELVA
ncbi:Tn3 family transposase [Trichlorobacter lovleyi]|uniref:Transposase Tn3 family protein n=1 Tax=Trichlorobacter lovleyi (strain ATCC BAA-1151 / DSM 17278 / SZ) TaxID=398767 RepID=B3EBW5_TRIL1|nr:Tn3 family transposase [Trichlorobacter lovleyi]ACD97397.1 transposase Tn3 family protein [Trichlorobacter lovleyi SZ]